MIVSEPALSGLAAETVNREAPVAMTRKSLIK